MIPGEPDCDYENGEKIFTPEEIAEFRESYKNYGIIDEEHTFLENNEKVGEPIEDYLLPGATKMTNIHGEEREYPRGTWVVKTKITDPDLMIKAEKGEIAYSPTVIPEEKAEALMAAKGRTLIKDVPNPVVYTLSLTTHPCIDNSCSVKAAIKEGRSISKENKTILEKARDILDNLIMKASDVEENKGDNMTKKDKNEENEEYVTKSDLEAFGEDIVKQLIGKANTEAKKRDEEAKKEDKPGKCPKCKSPIKSSYNYCPNCGAKIGKPDGKEPKKEDKEKSGKSKAIKNHDTGKQDTSFKSVEFYSGRDMKGRPIKE
jgi:hypothetical protein